MDAATTIVQRVDSVPDLIAELHRCCASSSLDRARAENAVEDYPVETDRMLGVWQGWLDDKFSKASHRWSLRLDAPENQTDKSLEKLQVSDDPTAFLAATAGLIALDAKFEDQAALFWDWIGSDVQPGDVLPVQPNILVQRYLHTKEHANITGARDQYEALSTRATSGGHGYPQTLDNFIVVTEEWEEDFDALQLVDLPQLSARFTQHDSPQSGGSFSMATASVLPHAAWRESKDDPPDLDIEIDEERKKFWVEGYRDERRELVLEQIQSVVRQLDEGGVELLVLPELTIFEPAIEKISEFLKTEAEHLRLVLAGSRHVGEDGERFNRTCLLYGLDEFGESDEFTGEEVVAARHTKFGGFSLPSGEEEAVERIPRDLQFVRLPIGSMSPLICADVLDASLLDEIKRMGATIYCVPSMTPRDSGFDNQFGGLSHFHQPLILWANCCGVEQQPGDPFQARERSNGIRMPVEDEDQRWSPTGCPSGACTPCSGSCCAQIVRIYEDATFDRFRWPNRGD